MSSQNSEEIWNHKTEVTKLKRLAYANLYLLFRFGDPKGNRTPVAGMKTRCPDR